MWPTVSFKTSPNIRHERALKADVVQWLAHFIHKDAEVQGSAKTCPQVEVMKKRLCFRSQRFKCNYFSCPWAEPLWDSHYFLLLLNFFFFLSCWWQASHSFLCGSALPGRLDRHTDSDLPASPPAEIWIRFPWVCLRGTMENHVIVAISTWHSVPLGLFTLFSRCDPENVALRH